MSWGLRVYVYAAAFVTWEDITDITRGLTIRCDVHGGVKTIEFEIADDYVDAYRWAYDHIGAKVYVFDNATTPPVAEGVIFEPGISQDGNRVTAFGPWLAYMYSQVYNDTASWVAAGQTGAQIEDMLTNECPDVSTNHDNVDEPATNNFPWQPSDNSYPGDLVAFLASLSDAAYAEWYFWLASAPLAGTTPAAPIPWFKTAANVPGLYTCWRKDMTPGGLDLTPSLQGLANDVRVMYRNSVGIQQQTTSIQDATSIARYGLRERWDYDLGSASRPAANQYRRMLRNRFKDPQQVASFTLNTWAYDRWGGKWPLWRVIADFPVKFTVNDLIPDNVVLGHTLDYKRTFITLAVEYDYDRNSLTVVPDTQDNRADALLSRHRGLQ